MPHLFYTVVRGSQYDALIALDNEGVLYYMSLGKANTESLKKLMFKDFSKIPEYSLNSLDVSTYEHSKVNQTIEYVAGAINDPRSMDVSKIKYNVIFGTTLQRRVWTRLLGIASGTVTDYSQLATDLNMPSSSRVIGNCVGANKLALIIPCHRVLTKGKKISGYRYGTDIKRVILKHELGNEYSKLVM